MIVFHYAYKNRYLTIVEFLMKNYKIEINTQNNDRDPSSLCSFKD